MQDLGLPLRYRDDQGCRYRQNFRYLITHHPPQQINVVDALIHQAPPSCSHVPAKKLGHILRLRANDMGRSIEHLSESVLLQASLILTTDLLNDSGDKHRLSHCILQKL